MEFDNVQEFADTENFKESSENQEKRGKYQKYSSSDGRCEKWKNDNWCCDSIIDKCQKVDDEKKQAVIQKEERKKIREHRKGLTRMKQFLTSKRKNK
jgi:hypothetical protein